MPTKSEVLDDDCVPRRCKHYKVCGEREVLVFEDAVSCHRLRGLAADVWNQCDGVQLGKLMRRLETQYQSVPPTQLKEDLTSTLAALVEKRLLELFPKAPASVRVLFVEPPAPDPQHFGKSKEVSLGLSYLCGVSQDLGFSSAILDLRTAELPWTYAEDTLRTLRPEVVGITATSPGFESARAVGHIAKRLLPHSLVMMGGPT